MGGTARTNPTTLFDYPKYQAMIVYEIVNSQHLNENGTSTMQLGLETQI